MSREKRKPIHYRFVSIDEECAPSSSYPRSRTTTTTTSTTTSTMTPSSPQPELHDERQQPLPLPDAPTSLLHQFYDELMIPTFPLEEERDDVLDWLECFTAQRKLRMRRNRNRYWNEVREVLMDGLLEEVGIVDKVMKFMKDDGDDGDGDGDGEFDGPAMDVILMVQNHDHDIVIDSIDDDDDDDDAVNEDARKQFFKRGSSRNLLLQTQKSLYGGLYVPKDVDGNNHSADNDGVNGGMGKDTNGTSTLMNRAISEEEANETRAAVRRLHDTNMQQFSKMNCRHGKNNNNSLLGKQVSLYGGLYASTHGEANKCNDDDDGSSDGDQDEDEAEEETVDKAMQDVATATTTTTINNNNNINIQNNSQSTKQTIIGGAAVEYYKRSRAGLLSYVVLHDEFRGCGLARKLHEEALRRLEALAKSHRHRHHRHRHRHHHGNNDDVDNDDDDDAPEAPLLRAVFAETNTPAAGDVTPSQSLLRHKSLYNLGYRLVGFPYAQPPLTTVDVNATFDDLVLLVYFPWFENDAAAGAIAKLERKERSEDEDGGLIMERYCPWFMEEQRHRCGGGNDDDDDDDDGDDDGSRGDGENSNTVQMNVNIPFGYVEDFYRSVFHCNSEECTNDDNDDTVGSERIPDYRTADYYKFAHWFAHDRPDKSKGVVEVSLRSPTMPWEDCKDRLKLEWKEWEERYHHCNNDLYGKS